MPFKCLRRCEWEEDERTPEDLFLSVINPNLSTNSLVLCVSRSAHKDEQVLLESFGGQDVDVDLKIIPLKTTKYAQPLDMYFFMQCKIYAKRITDMKLHSVIYNNYLRKHIDQC